MFPAQTLTSRQIFPSHGYGTEYLAPSIKLKEEEKAVKEEEKDKEEEKAVKEAVVAANTGVVCHHY